MLLRLKRIPPDQFMGLWCNWQHDGLLIRSARVRISPAPLATHRRVAQG